MSPHIMFELAETRRDAKTFAGRVDEFERQLVNLAKRFHGVRNNERHLVSRNKEQGWYTGSTRLKAKEWALRYRKQTGAQVVRVKEKKYGTHRN